MMGEIVIFYLLPVGAHVLFRSVLPRFFDCGDFGKPHRYPASSGCSFPVEGKQRGDLQEPQPQGQIGMERGREWITGEKCGLDMPSGFMQTGVIEADRKVLGWEYAMVRARPD